MISERDNLEASDEHAVALDCIKAAIEAAAPGAATRSSVTLDRETLTVDRTDYDLTSYEQVLLVGGGKAAGGVTRELESLLGDRISDGLIISKQSTTTDVVRSIAGDHPLPSQRNVEAATNVLNLVDAAGEETLVLFVLTGGASALLTAPAGDLTLDDIQETTELLLDSGVPIGEINAVRKHLSECKGGQLARRAAPAHVVGLLLSDVVDNDLSTIGSGPTVPDETTYEDALLVFDRYGIDPPQAVREYLTDGVDSAREETPFEDDVLFECVDNHLIGDNGVALDAAREVSEAAGYMPLVLTSRLRGEASEVAKSLVAVAKEVAATGTPVKPPAVLLAGGETTVSITGEGGQGGPNQELVLSAALERAEDVVIAAVDTDGEDGSSTMAGAIADATTVAENPDRARASLAANDTGTYLSSVGATIETGPTGTNVNDIVILVVGDSDE